MTEMNHKVYVITKGSYSDYHICAVTMDKDRAEKMRKLFSDSWDYATINEYTLEEAKDEGRVYYVEFPEDSSPEIYLDEYNGFGQYKDGPCISTWKDPICVYVHAKDEKQAMKIAQDEYARWKAEREGVV